MMLFGGLFVLTMRFAPLSVFVLLLRDLESLNLFDVHDGLAVAFDYFFNEKTAGNGGKMSKKWALRAFFFHFFSNKSFHTYIQCALNGTLIIDVKYVT